MAEVLVSKLDLVCGVDGEKGEKQRTNIDTVCGSVRCRWRDVLFNRVWERAT